MNFLHGRVVSSRPEACQIDLHGLGLITCPERARRSINDRVVVAVRPEWIRIDAPSGETWRGYVTERQYFGERCHVHVNLPKSGRSITASVRGVMPDLGKEVGVLVDFEKALVFEDGASTTIRSA